MFVRKKKNRSGSTSVVVVDKRGGRCLQKRTITKENINKRGYNKFLELENDVKVVIFTEKRIEVHVCICFVAYKVYKEPERILKISGIGKTQINCSVV
jgi:hypothetical protein